MPGLDELPRKDWGCGAAPAIRPLLLSRGTLETIDMAKTRALGEALGFVCVDLSPDCMLMRHGSDRAGGIYWVLEARLVTELRSPQRLSNHWGIWVPTAKDVDAARELLVSRQAELGLARIQPTRMSHVGARDYSFYFEDISRNWWEIGEAPAEEEMMKTIGGGDWDVGREMA